MADVAFRQREVAGAIVGNDLPGSVARPVVPVAREGGGGALRSLGTGRTSVALRPLRTCWARRTRIAHLCQKRPLPQVRVGLIGEVASRQRHVARAVVENRVARVVGRAAVPGAEKAGGWTLRTRGAWAT